jgi:hypothetical protein
VNSARSNQRQQRWSSYRTCLRRYREEARVTEQQYQNELIYNTPGPTQLDPSDNRKGSKRQ